MKTTENNVPQPAMQEEELTETTAQRLAKDCMWAAQRMAGIFDGITHANLQGCPAHDVEHLKSCLSLLSDAEDRMLEIDAAWKLVNFTEEDLAHEESMLASLIGKRVKGNLVFDDGFRSKDEFWIEEVETNGPGEVTIIGCGQAVTMPWACALQLVSRGTTTWRGRHGDAGISYRMTIITWL